MLHSVIPKPAESIYTDALAGGNLEERESQTSEAVIYSKGENQR